jgi:hypothetical protein
VTVAYPDDVPPDPGGGVYPPRQDPTEYLEGGRAILAALEAVVATERTGTAWLMGGKSGALHFRNGRVVGAELDGSACARMLLVASGRLAPDDWDNFAWHWSRTGSEAHPGAPPARGMSILEWSALALDATAEAAFELLPTGRDDVVADMVFQPGGIPGWTGSVRPAGFSWLRREIARRQSVLDRLRFVVTPDSRLVRATPEWAGPVQVSAQQWRVLSALPDGATARSVGRRIGLGTFATTLAVRTLMHLGMVATTDVPAVSGRAAESFSRTLFMDALSAAG